MSNVSPGWRERSRVRTERLRSEMSHRFIDPLSHPSWAACVEELAIRLLDEAEQRPKTTGETAFVGASQP